MGDNGGPTGDEARVRREAVEAPPRASHLHGHSRSSRAPPSLFSLQTGLILSLLCLVFLCRFFKFFLYFMRILFLSSLLFVVCLVVELNINFSEHEYMILLGQ